MNSTTYTRMSAFTDISYTPGDRWHLSVSADYNQYNTQSFDKSISVPLIRAEITHYFLKNKRGVITLEVFDLLDKNTGIERMSEMNYLLERESNIIRRYAMLTFKYRLNKFVGKSGIDIKVNKR
jgi:hypothetical protein